MDSSGKGFNNLTGVGGVCVKIAAEVWKGECKLSWKDLWGNSLWKSYLGLSKDMCILRPGDILALNEICGSFLEDSFGASISPNRARLSSDLGTWCLGVHTLPMLQMQVPDLLILLAPSEPELYLKPSLQHFSQGDFCTALTVVTPSWMLSM